MDRKIKKKKIRTQNKFLLQLRKISLENKKSANGKSLRFKNDFFVEEFDELSKRSSQMKSSQRYSTMSVKFGNADLKVHEPKMAVSDHKNMMYKFGIAL